MIAISWSFITTATLALTAGVSTVELWRLWSRLRDVRRSDQLVAVDVHGESRQMDDIADLFTKVSRAIDVAIRDKRIDARNAVVRRSGDGFLIGLPGAMPLAALKLARRIIEEAREAALKMTVVVDRAPLRVQYGHHSGIMAPDLYRIVDVARIAKPGELVIPETYAESSKPLADWLRSHGVEESFSGTREATGESYRSIRVNRPDIGAMPV
jgi:hypothetical protein